MERDPNAVREKLRLRIREGYMPEYSIESSVDHGIGWMVLSREEFDRIVKETKNDLSQ